MCYNNGQLGGYIMKKTILFIFICAFSTLFLTIGYALELEETDENIKCGYNSSENNSIIVEDNNKCFKYLGFSKAHWVICFHFFIR